MMKSILTICAILSSLLAAGQKKKIVFVCEHGAAKSVIAANYFNQLAKENNLNWEAVSRATLPDSSLTKGTREGLKADHIYDPKRIPQKISYNDTVNVEKIILFVSLPQDFRTNVETLDWSTIDNIDSEYQNRKKAIVDKLMILITTLE